MEKGKVWVIVQGTGSLFAYVCMPANHITSTTLPRLFRRRNARNVRSILCTPRQPQKFPSPEGKSSLPQPVLLFPCATSLPSAFITPPFPVAFIVLSTGFFFSSSWALVHRHEIQQNHSQLLPEDERLKYHPYVSYFYLSAKRMDICINDNHWHMLQVLPLVRRAMHACSYLVARSSAYHFPGFIIPGAFPAWTFLMAQSSGSPPPNMDQCLSYSHSHFLRRIPVWQRLQMRVQGHSFKSGGLSGCEPMWLRRAILRS